MLLNPTEMARLNELRKIPEKKLSPDEARELSVLEDKREAPEPKNPATQPTPTPPAKP
jgi:hypothetical protein